MKPKSAFTLIEVLIVVLILGILTTIAFPAYKSYIINAKMSQAIRDLYQIRNIIMMEEEYGDGFDIGYFIVESFGDVDVDYDVPTGAPNFYYNVGKVSETKYTIRIYTSS